MKPSSRYLLITFLKIGATSWGGFMALISVLQKQLCEKDNLVSPEKMLQGISLASVLPGPMAVNVVAYTGYIISGIRGAILSVTGILLPPFVFMLVLSDVYFRYCSMPALNHFFYGVLPAVAAIITSVAINMYSKNIKDITGLVIAVAAALITFISKSYYTTLIIIIASAAAGYFVYHTKTTTGIATGSSVKKTPAAVNYKRCIVPVICIAVLLPALCFAAYRYPDTLKPFVLFKDIAAVFAGISISQFGGGYVVVPAMQKIIVDSLHWLSKQQFTDAIALGQVTPGPIFISATFIGYKLCGFFGAVVATIAVFAPASAIMIFCTRFMQSIIHSPGVKSVFKGINAAVIGMIFSAAISILAGIHTGILASLLLFVIVLFTLIKFKVNPVVLIPAAGIAGLFIF